MDHNDLTLEKLKISEKLDILTMSVDHLHKKVNKVESVVFGHEGVDGMYQQVKRLNDLASDVKNVLVKILWLITCFLIVKSIPSISSFFYNITHVNP